ncbi:hypothetical protein K505DRAFT_390216 [Melanomma pulvis-pyrius CBS 109.77]|uniref:Uncharacterized protein n=1 Tax=Melanomma pulvis-pyrius CBS 109.77 TaxID=1314802 RepID=A0A6A6X3W5_9PLEO|nr:hypothetical protein K505DRAFT_390216 [Melanomma pulvis-pyrius CBS 109.77]
MSWYPNNQPPPFNFNNPPPPPCGPGAPAPPFGSGLQPPQMGSSPQATPWGWPAGQHPFPQPGGAPAMPQQFYPHPPTQPPPTQNSGPINTGGLLPCREASEFPLNPHHYAAFQQPPPPTFIGTYGVPVGPPPPGRPLGVIDLGVSHPESWMPRIDPKTGARLPDRPGDWDNAPWNQGRR